MQTNEQDGTDHVAQSRAFLTSTLPVSHLVTAQKRFNALMGTSSNVTISDVSIDVCRLKLSIRTRQFSGIDASNFSESRYDVDLKDIELPIRVASKQGDASHEHFELLVKLKNPTTVLTTNDFFGVQHGSVQESEFSIVVKDQPTGDQLGEALAVVVAACKTGVGESAAPTA